MVARTGIATQSICEALPLDRHSGCPGSRLGYQSILWTHQSRMQSSRYAYAQRAVGVCVEEQHRQEQDLTLQADTKTADMTPFSRW